MLMTFGQYFVDIDAEKTRRFYERLRSVSEECFCDGCRNFEKAVDTLPQSVKVFFSTLGIDMKKACECYVNCKNEDGSLYYAGFYHLCGRLLEGKSAWRKIDENHAVFDETETFSVADNFKISFSKKINLLEDGFPQPVIQLDFFATIPWVLEKANTYA